MQAIKIPDWINITYGEQEKRQKQIGIGVNFYKDSQYWGVRQPFGFIIYKLFDKDYPIYFVSYSQSLTFDNGNSIVSFSTFRIIKYDYAKRKYSIIAKFEDTNFANRIIKSYKYRNAANGKINFYMWSPLIENVGIGKYYNSLRNGSISFDTTGCIPPSPGATHCKWYKINWILTSSDYLYAKEFHWDIRDEYDEKTKKTVQKATIVKLKP